MFTFFSVLCALNGWPYLSLKTNAQIHCPQPMPQTYTCMPPLDCLGSLCRHTANPTGHGIGAPGDGLAYFSLLERPNSTTATLSSSTPRGSLTSASTSSSACTSALARASSTPLAGGVEIDGSANDVLGVLQSQSIGDLLGMGGGLRPTGMDPNSSLRMEQLQVCV